MKKLREDESVSQSCEPTLENKSSFKGSIKGLLEHNICRLPGSVAEAYVLKDGQVFCQPELLCNIGCETPRINYEQYAGRKYRYFYAISSDVDATSPATMIKVDTFEKTCITWCEDNCYPSEPIFVPTPTPNSNVRTSFPCSCRCHLPCSSSGYTKR